MATHPQAGKINGFELPKSVRDFLPREAVRHLDFRVLNNVFGVDLEMDLKCSYYSLESETLALRRIHREVTAPLYGMRQGALRDSELLDADSCRCLGVNEAEEGICLDYRCNTDFPSIALSAWRGQPSEYATWLTVAEAFEAFLAEYNKGEQAGAGQSATLSE